MQNYACNESRCQWDEIVLEGFWLLVEIQNRHIVSNTSIVFRNFDDTVHTIGLILQVVQLF